MINKIIEEGADIEEVDASNKTPLMHAILNNNLEIVQILIKHAAYADKSKVVDKSNQNGPIALNYALKWLKENSEKDHTDMYKIIKLLLGNGAVATDKQLDFVKDNEEIRKLFERQRESHRRWQEAYDSLQEMIEEERQKELTKLLRTHRKLGPLKHTRKHPSNQHIHNPHYRIGSLMHRIKHHVEQSHAAKKGGKRTRNTKRR